MDLDAYEIGQAHVYLTKAASQPVLAHSLSGELYYSNSGWMLLAVPNSLVRGAFDALNEVGAELPLQDDGNLKAHISVMHPDEVKQIGGPDKVTERGHRFSYTLGPVKEIKPDGRSEMSKVWYIAVRSPELEKLRKSYGLSARPKNNEFEFHITIGVRRKHVLNENDVSKYNGQNKTAKANIIVGPSKIHGNGVFSTCSFQKGDDIGKALVGNTGEPGFKRTTLGRFVNHAADANTELKRVGSDYHLIARKPINQGDELTVNYQDVDHVLSKDNGSDYFIEEGYLPTDKPGAIRFTSVTTQIVTKKADTTVKSTSAADVSELEKDGRHEKIVTLDLEGTITNYRSLKDNDNFGRLRSDIRKSLENFRDKGYKIAIYTRRWPEDSVIKWLDDNGLIYDYINENTHQSAETC